MSPSGYHSLLLCGSTPPLPLRFDGDVAGRSRLWGCVGDVAPPPPNDDRRADGGSAAAVCAGADDCSDAMIDCRCWRYRSSGDRMGMDGLPCDWLYCAANAVTARSRCWSVTGDSARRRRASSAVTGSSGDVAIAATACTASRPSALSRRGLPPAPHAPCHVPMLVSVRLWLGWSGMARRESAAQAPRRRPTTKLGPISEQGSKERSGPRFVRHVSQEPRRPPSVHPARAKLKAYNCNQPRTA